MGILTNDLGLPDGLIFCKGCAKANEIQGCDPSRFETIEQTEDHGELKARGSAFALAIVEDGVVQMVFRQGKFSGSQG
jgi:hypothetical protein